MITSYKGRALVGPFDYATQPPVRDGVYLFVLGKSPRMVRHERGIGLPAVPGYTSACTEDAVEDAARRCADRFPSLGPSTRTARYIAGGAHWYGLEPTEADKAAMAAQEV